VGARNPASEMPPRYGIRMARTGFCPMWLTPSFWGTQTQLCRSHAHHRGR
jgi:hypothetical protein